MSHKNGTMDSILELDSISKKEENDENSGG